MQFSQYALDKTGLKESLELENKNQQYIVVFKILNIICKNIELLFIYLDLPAPTGPLIATSVPFWALKLSSWHSASEGKT